MAIRGGFGGEFFRERPFAELDGEEGEGDEFVGGGFPLHGEGIVDAFGGGVGAAGAEVEVGEEEESGLVEGSEAAWEFEGFDGVFGAVEVEQEAGLEDGVGGDFGALFDDFVEEGDGFEGGAGVLEALGDAGFPVEDFGFGDLCEAVCLERAGPFAALEAAVSEEAVGGAVGVAEADGFEERGERFLQVAFAGEGHGQVAVGAAEGGVEVDGLLVGRRWPWSSSPFSKWRLPILKVRAADFELSGLAVSLARALVRRPLAMRDWTSTRRPRSAELTVGSMRASMR